MTLRLWLDDVRPAPEGWVWARTVDEAKEILLANEVTECSLDHDLGLNFAVEAGVDVDDFDELLAYAQSLPDRAEETGMDLVNWMIDYEKVPPVVTIHSWNILRAKEMAARFNYHGYSCLISPFKVVKQ